MEVGRSWKSRDLPSKVDPGVCAAMHLVCFTGCLVGLLGGPGPSSQSKPEPELRGQPPVEVCTKPVHHSRSSLAMCAVRVTYLAGVDFCCCRWFTAKRPLFEELRCRNSSWKKSRRSQRLQRGWAFGLGMCEEPKTAHGLLESLDDAGRKTKSTAAPSSQFTPHIKPRR